MVQTLKTAIAIVDSDIGKNLFNTVGLDQRGAICAAAEVVAWPSGSKICKHAAVPYRRGGLRRRASS